MSPIDLDSVKEVIGERYHSDASLDVFSCLKLKSQKTSSQQNQSSATKGQQLDIKIEENKDDLETLRDSECSKVDQEIKELADCAEMFDSGVVHDEIIDQDVNLLTIKTKSDKSMTSDSVSDLSETEIEAARQRKEAKWQKKMK